VSSARVRARRSAALDDVGGQPSQGAEPFCERRAAVAGARAAAAAWRATGGAAATSAGGGQRQRSSSSQTRVVALLAAVRNVGERGLKWWLARNLQKFCTKYTVM